MTITEVEPTDPPSVEDERAFEEELRQELEHSYERLNVPESKRRRTNGMLRDSSVELSGPLDPPMDDRPLIPLEEVMKLVGEDDDGDGREDDEGSTTGDEGSATGDEDQNS